MRLEVLASLVLPAKSFADVGCDHGYIAKAVLDRALSEDVYITDISQSSLNKGITLLDRTYKGMYTAILTDGLVGVPCVSEVMIAGMGGEEIIKILQKSAYKPDILILQPMKNADKVRRFLHNAGYGLDKDFLFYDGGKYYEVMRARLSLIDGYTEKEELYGRGNLNGNPDFIRFLNAKIKEVSAALSADGLNKDSFARLTEKLESLRGLINEIT